MSGQSAPLAATSWSSSLSVAEAAAVREAGFTPRGLVMGSSVYHLGLDYSPMQYQQPSFGYGGYRPRTQGWSKYYTAAELGYGGGWGGVGGPSAWGAPQAGAGGVGWRVGPVAGGMGPWGNQWLAFAWERVVFESGIEEAAGLATSRLTREAQLLGAHGVVGVRLAFRYLPDMISVVEFTALGTAVVRPGAAPLPVPFTSHLDGQALLKLLDAGLVPVSVLVGAGSVRAEMPRPAFSGQASDLAPFGDAIEASRRIAAERMQAQRAAQGWAVVGTLASTGQQTEGGAELATTVLTGTVVRRFDRPATGPQPLPVMRLSRP